MQGKEIIRDMNKMIINHEPTTTRFTSTDTFATDIQNSR